MDEVEAGGKNAINLKLVFVYENTVAWIHFARTFWPSL